MHENRILKEADIDEELEQTEQSPLLYIDVNLGHELRRIVVNQGDSSRHLAREFCDEHNLDEETYEKLEKLLYE